MHPIISQFHNLGPEAITAKIIHDAPYFASIDPLLTELKVGRAVVKFKNQRGVQNHLKTVHAIAMCNAAELVAGITTTVSIPQTMRWIPKGMTVEYLAKARTDLTVVAEAERVDFSEVGDLNIPVSAYDSDGVKVFRATVSMNIKPESTAKNHKET